MKAIHVTHKSTDVAHMPRKAAGRPGEYESGNWVVSRKRAKALKGGKIYLHHSRDEPSFGGGTITDFSELTPKEKYIRVIFYYTPDPKYTGVVAPADGWRNEYRMVK
jgi:hypothetical protein